MDNTLGILGIGSFLPPARPFQELIDEADLRADGRTIRDLFRRKGEASMAELRAKIMGAEQSRWEYVRVGSPEDQPSVMGARALQRSLEASGIQAKDLSLVISSNSTSDYHNGWSMAAEIMRLVGAPETCLGIDAPHACLGMITALELARSWLSANGGGYAAVINAESWRHMRRSFLQLAVNDAAMHFLLFWGDGASAGIVSNDRPGDRIATYRGAVFNSLSQLSGQWLFPYGGTCIPEPPPGEDRHSMRISTEIPRETMVEILTKSFVRLNDTARAKFGVNPDKLVCLQVSPNYVRDCGRLFGLEAQDVALTGDASGHMSAADMLLGIDNLHQKRQLQGHVFLVADAVVATGIGLLEPA